MANCESLNEFSVHPYMFEPVATVRATTEAAQESESQPATFTRVGNTDWCSCTHCVQMEKEEDCFCCLEIRQIRDRQKHRRCITTTKKFKNVCLNKDVLEVALQQNGTPVDSSSQMSVRNRKLRHAGYTQFVYMTWKRTGRENRIILPSCVLNSIRKKYPDPDGKYIGFKHSSG